VNKESVLYYDTVIRYHQVLLLNIMKHTNIGACETWIIYYMDWKRDILRVEISDAILVKRCHDDLQNKFTETAQKKKKKQPRHCTSSAPLSLLDEIQPMHRLSASSKVPGALM